MPLNTDGITDATGALAAEITQMSLHSADPGATGTNETSAARQAVTLTDNGSGVLSVSNVAFTGGAANGPVSHCGFWAGATFKGSLALSGDATFNAAGEYTVTSATWTGSSTG
jgi:hypothetical protein